MTVADKAHTQVDKFKETARALECDEDEEAFKAKLRKVAKFRGKKASDKSPEDS